MTELSSVRNLQQLEKSMPSYPARARLARAVRANVTQRDLIIVVGFALLGLLVTLAVIANVPDFVPATIETTWSPEKATAMAHARAADRRISKLIIRASCLSSNEAGSKNVDGSTRSRKKHITFKMR